MKIWVLNGPNLGRLDLRDHSMYGDISFKDLVEFCVSTGKDLGLDVEVRQSDSETEIIHWLHEAADKKIPIAFNPAAFTHYSYAIRDAVAMLKAPSIEVHLSNPLSREEFRHTSVVSGVVTGTIGGFGLLSYELALRALANLLGKV
ncbi:MAG: 3-dehydroquinate dehydratase [Actinobacteria bacterium]|uniref:3-dehydroquinate dehydratase n=1 Tax=Candidatus Fonsibacter lacus TaxID=2576439 RepID=A0A965LKK8_9PROT|nr:3-dehydroquinate dehydratase [Candidatus Fonsibacter lacus]